MILYTTLCILVSATYAAPADWKWLPVVALLGVVALTPARGRR